MDIEDFTRNITFTKCLIARNPEGGWLHERTQVFAYIGMTTFVFVAMYTLILALQVLFFVGIHKQWWCSAATPPPPPVVYCKSAREESPKQDLEAAEAARILYAKLMDPRVGSAHVSCCQSAKEGGEQ